MTTTIVGEYLTQSGQDGLTVKRHENARGDVSYSYTGKWGAGSGSNLDDIRKRVAQTIDKRRGIQVVRDFLNERKANPIMATAKQIAARKEFARIMKSGGFGAKAKPRKKNPIAGKSGRTSANKPTAAARNGVAHKMVMQRKSNPHAGSAREDLLMRNPKKRIPAASRAINPASRAPSRFAVHRATAAGQPAALLGSFPMKATAVEYAKAYAKAHGCGVVIVGKGL